MSPLIDVTNMVTSDVVINHVTDFRNSSSDKLGKDCSEENPSINKKDVGTYKNGTKFKTSKIKSKRVRSKFRQSTSKSLDSQIPILAADVENHSCRVPPLPCVELLSNAVQSLNINSQVPNSKKALANKNLLENGKENHINKYESKLTGSSNGLGPTPNSFSSTTYQCVACSLELSSMENLTHHLIKHVYEGLHAASWLNNAMSTLLFPITSNEHSTTTEVHGSVEEPLQSNSMSLVNPNEEHLVLNSDG